MQASVQTSDDLRVLVSRYARSSSIAIVCDLCKVLAHWAEHPTQETAPLVYQVIATLRRPYFDNILVFCARTIWLQIMYDALWEPLAHPPPVLFPFIQACLDYPEDARPMVSTTIWGWGIALVELLYEKNLLLAILTPQQLTWLRGKLRDLAALQREEFDKLLWMEDFYREQPNQNAC